MQSENGSSGGAVFVQTNEADANRVLAFRRPRTGNFPASTAIRRAGAATASRT
jgi:hypothetical protein